MSGPPSMLHYTLNTGHTRVSPRAEVSDHAIAVIRPLLQIGVHALPIAGYEVNVVDALTAMIFATATGAVEVPMPGPPVEAEISWPRMCVNMSVAADDAAADRLWPLLEEHYLGVTECRGFRSADFASPKRPATTPWCAAFVVLATPDEAAWIADFERCLAWAWIEKQRADQN